METQYRDQAHAYQAYMPQAVPGLKVAYGEAATAYYQTLAGQMTLLTRPSAEPAKREPGLFERLKDTLINLVTEEVEAVRPIGLSQLTRHTFQVSEDAGERTIYHGSRRFADYRFNQMITQNRY